MDLGRDDSSDDVNLWRSDDSSWDGVSHGELNSSTDSKRWKKNVDRSVRSDGDSSRKSSDSSESSSSSNRSWKSQSDLLSGDIRVRGIDDCDDSGDSSSSKGLSNGSREISSSNLEESLDLIGEDPVSLVDLDESARLIVEILVEEIILLDDVGGVKSDLSVSLQNSLLWIAQSNLGLGIGEIGRADHDWTAEMKRSNILDDKLKGQNLSDERWDGWGDIDIKIDLRTLTSTTTSATRILAAIDTMVLILLGTEINSTLTHYILGWNGKILRDEIPQKKFHLIYLTFFPGRTSESRFF